MEGAAQAAICRTGAPLPKFPFCSFDGLKVLQKLLFAARGPHYQNSRFTLVMVGSVWRSCYLTHGSTITKIPVLLLLMDCRGCRSWYLPRGSSITKIPVLLFSWSEVFGEAAICRTGAPLPKFLFCSFDRLKGLEKLLFAAREPHYQNSRFALLMDWRGCRSCDNSCRAWLSPCLFWVGLRIVYARAVICGCRSAGQCVGVLFCFVFVGLFCVCEFVFLLVGDYFLFVCARACLVVCMCVRCACASVCVCVCARAFVCVACLCVCACGWLGGLIFFV